MSDQLAIDLFVNDAKADATLSRFRSNLHKTDTAASAVGNTFAKDIGAQISIAEQRLAEFERRREVAARRQSLGINSLADFQANKVQATRNEALRPFFERAAVGGSREAFDLTRAKSATLEGIAELEKEAVARAAKAGSLAGKNFSAAFGSAAQNIAQDLAQGSSLSTALLTNVSSLGTAVTSVISVGAIAASASVAAVGAVIIHWSQVVRTEAERRLKVEELIQGAINRQIIAQKQFIADAQKAREDAAKDRQFNDFLQGGSVEDLERRKAALEKLASLGGSPGKSRGFDAKGNFLGFEESEQTLRTQEQLKELDAQIFEARKKGNEANRQSLDEHWESWKRNQEAERAFEKSRLEDIEKAKAKVEELGKSYISAFANIGVGKDNPFVRLYNEGEEALKSFREQTKGLSADLVRQGEQLIKRQTDLARFRARLDASLQAIDLRDEARTFREPTKRAKEIALANDINEFRRVSNSTNPDVFLEFQRRAKEIASFERLRFQETLDEKIRAASGAKTPEEQAIAERKIIDLTRGVNVDDLTASERQAAAQARDNEAIRVENEEREARQAAVASAGYLKNINEYIEELKKKATQGGTKALEVVFKDETGRVAGVKTTTPDDVRIQMGLVGGPGGLTNF